MRRAYRDLKGFIEFFVGFLGIRGFGFAPHIMGFPTTPLKTTPPRFPPEITLIKQKQIPKWP